MRPPRRRRVGGGVSLIAGVVILAAIVGAVVVGPGVVPSGADTLDLRRAWAPPSADHPLGRDGLGRDVLARLLVGGRTTLATVALALGLATLVGVGLGWAAGALGGVIDVAVKRVSDLALGFPELATAIAAATLIGPGPGAVVVAIALAAWPGTARLVQAMVAGLSKERFVLASTALGAGAWHILVTHLAPHLAGPLAVRTALVAAPAIMAEVSLSVLGIGVQDPGVSWGVLIRDGLAATRTGPHLIASVTAAVALTVLGLTLVADGIRDAQDPVTKRLGANPFG